MNMNKKYILFNRNLKIIEIIQKINNLELLI